MTILGRLALVAISTDGTNYTTIGRVKEISHSQTADEVDVTTHDDAFWRRFMQGYKEGTVELSGLQDLTDAGLAALQTAWTDGLERYFRIRPRTGAGAPQTVIMGTVTNLSLTYPLEEAADFSATIRQNGAPTVTTQA